MRENNIKTQRESNTAFAVAAFLLNLLILVVVCGSVWLINSLLTDSNHFGLFLRETALR